MNVLSALLNLITVILGLIALVGLSAYITVLRRKEIGVRKVLGASVINITTLQKGLLHLPVLYLSRYVIRHKNDYYRLLQTVRDTDEWEEWILFILDGIEQTANESIVFIAAIRKLMQQYKHEIRSRHPRMYSQDLLNNLFKYPYTKIEFIQHDLGVSRNTAIRYLDVLVGEKILSKRKLGRDNYFINEPLFALLSGS